MENNIVKSIKTLLKKRGLKVNHLAKECDVATATMYNYLNGKTNMPIKTAKKIESFLGYNGILQNATLVKEPSTNYGQGHKLTGEVGWLKKKILFLEQELQKKDKLIEDLLKKI